ncbi:HAD family hydrolase [Streptomyces sulphureus]|uniref:HAD family hydrolase n=1 Tax=Streptomyces sulphureus TaxID=47758 RepID=UPI0003634049|nr:HAD hydrolase-like protein [Streptomyces sulphureus]
MGATAHIVWDWNGTLLDDLDITVQATDHACRLVGGAPVDHARYRDCFTRPVRAFYERLLERDASEDEWRVLAEGYHRHYRDNLARAALRHGTRGLLAELADSGVTHSLLSMTEHDELLGLVEAHGLRDSFQVVDGAPKHRRADGKTEALREHLTRLTGLRGSPLPSEQVLLVGDALDDGHAASGSGAACVLLADGAYAPGEPQRLGLHVAETLHEAARTGLQLLEVRR